MPQITWRNVDAPNFNGALEGFRQFSDMLSTGLGGIGKAVGQFDHTQNEAAANAALAQASQIQDPDAYKAAMQSGQFLQGLPSRAITGKFLEQLDNRAGTLLDRAVTGEDLANKTYTHGRTRDMNGRQDAAAPGMAQAMLSMFGGDKAGAQAAVAGNPALGNLPPEMMQTFIQNLQGTQTRNTAQAVTDFDFGQKKLGVEHTRLASAAQSEIDKIGDVGPVQAREAAMRVSRGQPAEVQNAIRNYTEQKYPGSFGANSQTGLMPTTLEGLAAAGGPKGAAAGGNGGSAPVALGGGSGSMSVAPGTGAHGTKNGSGWDMTVGGIATPKPLTQMTLGEVQDFGKSTLIPSNRGKFGNPEGVGSSASGAFQITGETLDTYAPKVLGADWKSKPFTPENQDKIAQAIFEAKKGGNLKKTWSSLPDSAVGAYKDKTWAEVKGEITKGEVGGVGEASQAQAALDAATTRLAGTAAGIGVNQRQSQNASSPVMAKLPELRNNKSQDYEVAKTLVGADGLFKDWSEERALGMLRGVMNETGENASVAAEILRSSKKSESWVDRAFANSPTSWFVNKFGRGNPAIDSNRLEEITKSFSSGDVNNSLMRDVQDNTTAQQQTAAQQLYDTARAARMRAEQLSQSGMPEAASALGQLRANESQAQQLLAAANRGSASRTPTPVQAPVRGNELGPPVPAGTPQGNKAAPKPEAPPATGVTKQIMDVRTRAQALPLGSQERASLLQEIVRLEIQRAAEEPGLIERLRSAF